MEIKEVKERLSNLKQQMQLGIGQFEKETGVEITEVNFNSILLSSGNKLITIDIVTKL